MTNDVLEFNAIVENMGHNIVELAQIGRDGFTLSPVVTSEDLAAIIALPLRSWQPAGQDLIWFQAFRTVVYARQIIEEAGRIFGQMEDAQMAGRMDTLLEVFDDQLHPGQTAFQVYERLLSRRSTNNPKNGEAV